MNSFQSHFAAQLSAYVELRVGLGFQFTTQIGILRLFDDFVCNEAHEGPLTEELAVTFAADRPGTSARHRARCYQVVRHFSEYLAIFDPQAPVLSPKALGLAQARSPLHIFTDHELACLMEEARNISPQLPVRGVTLYAIIGLAVSTGLRIGEVVRLDKPDVDLESGVLLIRQTKFAKNRLVPVHPTTLQILGNYAGVRDATYRTHGCPAFFVNTRGRRIRKWSLQRDVRILTRRLGLRGPKGRGPSFHSLRHAFAVRRLVAWYRAGVDVQAMLPMLATYMGHVHYTDTAYYLTATAELLGLACEGYQRKLRQKGCERE